jgi:hypothetical protein
MSAPAVPVLSGLVVGHIVFYVLFILPITTGRSILTTPMVLKWLFRELEKPAPAKPVTAEPARAG